MKTINIRDKRIQLDIESELNEYYFSNARWTSDKLIASSPFRNDQAPSFFVNLSGEYVGTWGDSGAHDDDKASGNFVKLIAMLNDMPYEDAEEYLFDKYGITDEINPDEPIRLNQPKLRLKRPPVRTIANPVTCSTSPYLIRRGICPKAQALHSIGYDKDARGYTAFPIKTPAGDIASVFYRRSSFRDKRFFYHRDGEAKNRLLFGINVADKVAILNEGFIDALSWETLGYSALAVNGARISREQVEIIKRSPIERLYLAGDNDEQGRILNRQAAEALRGYVELYEIDYKKEKDANDALLRQGIQFMHDIFSEASRVDSFDRPILART